MCHNCLLLYQILFVLENHLVLHRSNSFLMRVVMRYGFIGVPRVIVEFSIWYSMDAKMTLASPVSDLWWVPQYSYNKTSKNFDNLRCF